MSKKKKRKPNLPRDPKHIFFKKFGISSVAPIQGIDEWLVKNSLKLKETKC